MSRPNFWNGKRCFIDGCDQPVEARGVCAVHFRRFQRHGSPVHKRPTFAEVRRQAVSDAVIALIQAKVLPATTSPQAVTELLALQPNDLPEALARARGKRLVDLPRANRDRRTWPPGRKPCSKCGKVKQLEDFHSDRNAVDGRSHMCCDCKVKYQRRWRKNRKSARRTAA